MSKPHLVHCAACDAVGAGGAEWYCYRCVEARDTTIAELRAEVERLKIDMQKLCEEREASFEADLAEAQAVVYVSFPKSRRRSGEQK